MRGITGLVRMLRCHDQFSGRDLGEAGATQAPACAGITSYSRRSGCSMNERPVPLFVPPEGRESAPPVAIPVPPVPVTYPVPAFELGIATVNADGRVREKKLIVIVEDLGWSPADRTRTTLVTDGIALRLAVGSGDQVDPRGQVLIPASPRALYGIAPGNRVVLVAVPDHEVLIVHSAAFVASLLAERYATSGVLSGH